MEVPK